MAEEWTSLDQELAGAVRVAVGDRDADATADALERLDAEHRALCDKRRRLHESIDLMSSAQVKRPDSLALLERYRVSERDISWRRQVLYRQIGELRSALERREREPGEGAAASGL